MPTFRRQPKKHRSEENERFESCKGLGSAHVENSGLSLPEIEISPISVRARNRINQLPCDANEGNRADSLVVTGFNVAQTLVQVLKQCGDNLTRENV